MNGSPVTCAEIAGSLRILNPPDYVQGTFEPQTDITAYELAIILPMILHGMTREGYDSLGPIQRHIKLAS